MGFGVADAEAQVSVEAVMQQGRTLADAVMRTAVGHIETRVVLEGLERHVLLITEAAGFPAGHGFHREHTAVFQVVFRRQQEVLVLLAIETNRQRVVLEQIDDRRAEQLHVIERRAHAHDAALADVEAQFEAAHLLEGVFRQRLENVQTVDVDEQELVLEGEIFLQVAIATEGVQRIRNQRFFFGKAHRFHPVAGNLERHRLAADAINRLAGAVERDQFDAVEVAQQAQVEHLADVALTGKVQAQLAQLQFAEVAVSAHFQTQAEQRAIALHRVIQRSQIQRQDFGRVTGAETAAHVFDRLARSAYRAQPTAPARNA